MSDTLDDHARSQKGLPPPTEKFRRDRLGSRVIALAEEEAKRRGRTRAALFTLTFQAPGFYLKQRYEIAMQIDCHPLQGDADADNEEAALIDSLRTRPGYGLVGTRRGGPML
jgi:hypothetical protein